jgi:hypothetical protein
MTRRHVRKTYFDDDQMALVRERADGEGLTVCAYLRTVALRDHERITVQGVLSEVNARLQQATGGDGSQAVIAALEPALVEVLHLLRLVAAQVSVQDQARITAATNQRYPNRKT